MSRNTCDICGRHLTSELDDVCSSCSRTTKYPGSGWLSSFGGNDE